MKTFSLILTAAVVSTLSACTTSQAVKNTQDAPEAVAKAPVKALNLQKKEIPENLTNLDNPYAAPVSLDCASIGAEIAELTEFLGPDWDSPDHYTKQGRTSGEFFDAILPYGGVVRFISGASEHEKKIINAVSYASVRRAKLKTTGASLGCSAPAAPAL